MRSLLILCLSLPSLVAAEPMTWTTYRGNPQRTGNTDGKSGPAKPGVLWVLNSQDNYVASPVPVGANIFVSGFGAFNRPTIAAIPMSDGKKAAWLRSAPYLRLATVSSPAQAGNAIVFGDGLHQDSGGVLHCLTADTAKPIWQLTLPGELIHLEGAPTIANGKVLMGAGSAGVLCVDLETAMLDNKPVTFAEIAKLQDAKWKELHQKYADQKKKDPDLAIPPSEDQLLKPEPKKHWQIGEKAWHVDAPVNVTGDKVLIGTSYLDKEKMGERALVCVDAKTGNKVWSQKLVYNPWGGATIASNLAIVGGSSIGMYPKDLKGAKGTITAFDLATGEPKWNKDIPGGIVASVAVSGELVVCTATDGKVRAFAIADGERRWIYDAKVPMFAPPAITAGVVYVGDLQGTIHAIGLTDGSAQWKFDLATEAKAPGMIYGGITVHDGKLFAATCNIEGANAGKPTCVICIGGK